MYKVECSCKIQEKGGTSWTENLTVYTKTTNREDARKELDDIFASFNLCYKLQKRLKKV